TFIQTSALAGAGLLVAGRRAFGQPLNPFKNLRKFIAPLPGLDLKGIPVATPNTTLYPGVDYYTIVMGQYQQQLHPELPPTRLWGYADATTGNPAFRYLGPAIVAQRGRPTRIRVVNRLPSVHPLPVDTSIMGAEPGQPVNRATVHLHGGFVPWPSDGGPFTWSAADGSYGESRVWWLPDNHGVLTDDLWYPNAQGSRLMWYHDHALGITRINAYAGLAAPYVITDDDESRMFGDRGTVLPGQLPGIPLVLQEKSFKAVADQFGQKGDLDYPTVAEVDPDDPATPRDSPPPFPSCVPEFFGDTIVINGMAFPQLTLPAGVYRFRMLNGTQSRMFNLQLYFESNSQPGEPNLNAPGPQFIQIGTEGGFLPNAAVVSSHPYDRDKYLAHDTTGYGLVLGGAERADLLLDFSEQAGQSFILYNDAAAPFPDGDDGNDYYTGSTLNGASGPLGRGPNTRTMMRIRITAGSYSGLRGSALLRRVNTELAKVDLGLLVPAELIGKSVTYPGANARRLTLNEGWDRWGRLIQMLGTDQASALDVEMNGWTPYGMKYMCDATETPSVGATEIWDIYNTTGDTHPIHFHLVNVQVLGRAPITVFDGGYLDFHHGKFVPPDANERGWKETVRMNPGEMTRVIMKFDLPPDPEVNGKRVTVPKSDRVGGYEYVWHCHILEHEEHDMMRPLVVK
ncbi:MAG: multicopper oxidase family protein, partial [Bacteroidales bacterium]